MIVDAQFVEGVIGGFGWGLLIGAFLGVRWFVAILSEDEKGPPK